MGKNQSKTLNSLLTTLGFAGGDERKARQQPGDVVSHSNSLNSISTAVSFNTESHLLSHSNSMDNLLRAKPNNNAGSKFKGQGSFMKRRDSGKVYAALVETSSVVTAFSDAVMENGGACDVTRSVPAKLTNHTKIRTDPTPVSTSNGSATTHRSTSCARRRSSGGVPGEVDGFSDKFVFDSGRSGRLLNGGEQGPISPQSLQPCGGELEGQGDLAAGPYLHPAIIKKLSHEEWQELISYACATLGHTLFTSILEKIQNSQLLLQSDQSELSQATDQSESTQATNDIMDGGVRHTSSNETGLTGSVKQKDVDGMCIESIEDLLLKLRELRCVDDDDKTPNTWELPKLERTVSLPPLNHHRLDSETQQPGHSLQLDLGEATGQQRRVDLDQDNALPHSRSRSHGESDYRHMRPHPHRPARRERKCTKCGAGGEGDNRYHLHGSRKRKGRCRSDGKQQDSGGSSTRVDPSLDDDCPGVLENRVRRSARHHQHLCKQCAAERGSRGKGGAGIAAPTGRKGWDGDHMIPPGWPVGNSSDGSMMVMTLEDVQRAAILLEKSTEFVESGEEEAQGRDDNHTPQVYPQTVSALLDFAPLGGNHSSTRDDMSESGRAEADYCWRDTPYLPSRSGRDSPATDMAVACLDMNSEKMLRPLNGSREGMMCKGHCQPQPHLHLHSHDHHHYHHIIHHHSQPQSCGPTD